MIIVWKGADMRIKNIPNFYGMLHELEETNGDESEGRLADVIKVNYNDPRLIRIRLLLNDKAKRYTGNRRSAEEAYIDKDAVDIDRILKEMAERDIEYKDLAASLGVSGVSISKKLNQKNRFKKDEMEKIEQLFSLENGSLLK